MTAPACPVCRATMAASAADFRREYPGAPDYVCADHLCRSRAWVNPDGSVTTTRTVEETIAEIHRRTPETKEARSAGQG